MNNKLHRKSICKAGQIFFLHLREFKAFFQIKSLKLFLDKFSLFRIYGKIKNIFNRLRNVLLFLPFLNYYYLKQKNSLELDKLLEIRIYFINLIKLN
jgi:hypothetical protein